MNVPINPQGFNDIYTDDIVGQMAHIGDNASRMAGSSMLAIHSKACPKQENEPIPREMMETLKELFAKAAPEEIKVILGWIVNYCRMIV